MPPKRMVSRSLCFARIWAAPSWWFGFTLWSVGSLELEALYQGRGLRLLPHATTPRVVYGHVAPLQDGVQWTSVRLPLMCCAHTEPVA